MNKCQMNPCKAISASQMVTFTFKGAVCATHYIYLLRYYFLQWPGGLPFAFPAMSHSKTDYNLYYYLKKITFCYYHTY